MKQIPVSEAICLLYLVPKNFNLLNRNYFVLVIQRISQARILEQSHFLLLGILLTQGSNLHLLHCQVDSFSEPPRKPLTFPYLGVLRRKLNRIWLSSIQGTQGIILKHCTQLTLHHIACLNYLDNTGWGGRLLMDRCDTCLVRDG